MSQGESKYRPAGLFRRTDAERADQLLSWQRDDQAFFAAGACHILARRGVYPDDDVISPEYGISDLAVAEEDRTVKWEAVLMMGNDVVVLPGRDWHSVAATPRQTLSDTRDEALSTRLRDGSTDEDRHVIKPRQLVWVVYRVDPRDASILDCHADCGNQFAVQVEPGAGGTV